MNRSQMLEVVSQSLRSALASLKVVIEEHNQYLEPSCMPTKSVELRSGVFCMLEDLTIKFSGSSSEAWSIEKYVDANCYGVVREVLPGLVKTAQCFEDGINKKDQEYTDLVNSSTDSLAALEAVLA